MGILSRSPLARFGFEVLRQPLNRRQLRRKLHKIIQGYAVDASGFSNLPGRQTKFVDDALEPLAGAAPLTGLKIAPGHEDFASLRAFIIA